MNLLIQFTEGDKRFFIAILLVLILVFVLAGYIGLLITKIMKWQGRRVDEMMHDIVETRVVSDKKSFKKVAYKKSWRYFFKTTWIPILIIMVAFAILLICESIYDFSYNIFDYHKTGFNTLFFIWEDTGEKHALFSFLGLEWSTTINLVHSPTFEVEALWSYFFVPIFLTGAIWYLVNVQCLISRAIRIEKSSRKIFSKSLDNINLSTIDQNDPGTLDKN
ncbi:MAG: hypothetical protein LBM03_01110 [Erysipelotrichaceae bacterium]|jgi:hypothetical protein|nr:hypothetical protein [Erysipelotrichaceae bacterium]